MSRRRNKKIINDTNNDGPIPIILIEGQQIPDPATLSNNLRELREYINLLEARISFLEIRNKIKRDDNITSEIDNMIDLYNRYLPFYNPIVAANKKKQKDEQKERYDEGDKKIKAAFAAMDRRKQEQIHSVKNQLENAKANFANHKNIVKQKLLEIKADTNIDIDADRIKFLNAQNYLDALLDPRDEFYESTEATRKKARTQLAAAKKRYTDVYNTHLQPFITENCIDLDADETQVKNLQSQYDSLTDNYEWSNVG